MNWTITHVTHHKPVCKLGFLNLASGPYFTPVDLAQHAFELDEAERQTMAEGDINSEEYVRFMNVCSRLNYFSHTG